MNLLKILSYIAVTLGVVFVFVNGWVGGLLMLIGLGIFKFTVKKQGKKPFEVDWSPSEVVDSMIRLDPNEKLILVDENVQLIQKGKLADRGKLYMSSKEVGFLGNTKTYTMTYSNITSAQMTTGGSLKIAAKDKSEYIIFRLANKQRAALYCGLIQNIEKIKASDQKVHITVIPE